MTSSPLGLDVVLNPFYQLNRGPEKVCQLNPGPFYSETFR